MQTATMAIVPNPNVVRRPASEAVTHYQGITTYKPPPEATIKVERHKSDVVGHMYDRRQITEVMYMAARKFQKTWESSEAPYRSVSDLREFVDGGRGVADGVTDSRLDAGKTLIAWSELLGVDGFVLVRRVLIDKHTIRQIADAGAMMPGKAATTFMGHLFRRQLTVLAKAMGFG